MGAKAKPGAKKPASKQAASKKTAKQPSSTKAAQKSMSIGSTVAAQAPMAKQLAPELDEIPEFLPALKYKATRMINKKLAVHGSKAIKNARNKKGWTIDTYVCLHYYKCEKEGKNVTQDFWTDLEDDFGLIRLPWDTAIEDQEEKDTDPDIHDDVLEQIGRTIHGSNPSTKYQAITMLEKKLKLLPTLPFYQIKAVFVASCQAPGITPEMSARMMLAVTTWAAKKNIPADYPQLWDVTNGTLQTNFISHWETLSDGMGRQTFLAKYFRECCLWCDEHDLAHVRDKTSKDPPESPDVAVLNRLLSTSLGGSLFLKEAHQAQWASFCTQCKVGIQALCDEGWTEESVQKHQDSMQTLTRQLVASGHAPMGKEQEHFFWVGYLCEFSISAIDDFWQLPQYSATTCIALNSDKAAKMPWEIAILGDSKIDKYPSYCPMEDAVVEDIVLSREHANSLLKNTTLFADWVRVLTKTENSNNLLKLNCNWVVDVEFLNKYAKALILARLRKEVKDSIVIDELAETDFTHLDRYISNMMQKTVKKLELLYTKDFCVCLGLQMGAKEVDFALDFCKGVMSADAADCDTTQKLAEHEKEFVLALEPVAKCKGGVQMTGSNALVQMLNAGASSRSTVEGKDAVAIMYQRAHRKYYDPATDKGAFLSEVHVFLMCSWMLTSEQLKEANMALFRDN